jgi:uncharacterized protein YbjT (DUF2867 family)
VVNAAIAAGVGHLVHTSVLRAGSTQLAIAPEHKATERVIRQSNVPFTFLRNSFYTENYTAQIPSYLPRGGSWGSGRRAHLGCLTSRLRGCLRHRTDPGQPPERGIRAGRSAIHHGRRSRGGLESYRDPP